MKILFMGTSEFAVPILKALHNSEHNVLHVFTAPSKQAGRGHKMQQSPISKTAKTLHIPASYPKTLKTPEALQEIKTLAPDVIIVASYGKILTTPVLNACKYGCINVHPSALPRWRGAAPIERTILAGDKKTAVCIMQMDEGIDTGDIYLSEDAQVSSGVTAPELRDQLAGIGGRLLIKVLDNFSSFSPQKQSEVGVTYAKKLEKEESIINWNNSADYVEQMIRAFDPWPGCFFEYKGETIRILEAEVAPLSDKCKPGFVLDKNLSVCCKDGILKPKRLQRPGKKPLLLKDFLNGLAIPKGTLLTR